MTAHQIRAVAYLAAALIGVGLIVAVNAWLGPWGAIGATCGFVAGVLAVCRPGETW